MANIYDMTDTWNNGATTFTAIKMDVEIGGAGEGIILASPDGTRYEITTRKSRTA
jgi:hypothetical protein